MHDGGCLLKAVILAGGLGTRLAEETGSRPKPMVEIGGQPILWHILKIYHAHGINDFVICLGYKGYVIKEYFANYYLHRSDVTVDLGKNTIEFHQAKSEPWRVTLVDTGDDTMIGGRIKRILPYVENDDAFCLTYGDGVGDVDITSLIDFHRREGRLATVSAMMPPGRFGAIKFDGARVTGFEEKPAGDGGWINGGFFVLSPKVVDYIDGDSSVWEKEPMERLAADGQLSVRHHHGFWHPMDTLRDKRYLEDLWTKGKAPWKIW
ncbi:glucose-1-phosphate cytidylyltransferase [Humitalea sp. 24SJ18S-53]|uniref:glucose-1-phosphate cytidylyltransferase n=1 Tax=Humitalea sp. 24SJ18S-53 TaxID=3422307 RepID=UPI003D664056